MGPLWGEGIDLQLYHHQHHLPWVTGRLLSFELRTCLACTTLWVGGFCDCGWKSLLLLQLRVQRLLVVAAADLALLELDAHLRRFREDTRLTNCQLHTACGGGQENVRISERKGDATQRGKGQRWKMATLFYLVHLMCMYCFRLNPWLEDSHCMNPFYTLLSSDQTCLPQRRVVHAVAPNKKGSPKCMCNMDKNYVT